MTEMTIPSTTTCSNAILSSRDLNSRWDDDDDDDDDKDDDEDFCVEKIRERFDRDFLSKYGYLWRRMIREKKEIKPFVVYDTDDDDRDEGDDCIGPRAIDFVDAIERKQAVAISVGRSKHNTDKEEYDCRDCGPSIEEFVVELPEEDRMITTITNNNDSLVDTDDDDVDENDEGNNIKSYDDDDEEVEWIPDDDELDLPTSKVVPKVKRQSESEKSERPWASETIDLCDTSSFDETADSDSTLTDDDDDDDDDDEQIAATIVTKKQIIRHSKASFQRNRDQITELTFDEFNRKAFKGGLEKVTIQWSKKLNTTAGITRLQKETRDMTPGVPLRRRAVIELSTKVVDDQKKLRETLLHELVHAAAWIFEGVSRPPHGAVFKRWAKIAMAKIPDVIVTTYHTYEIRYKYNWACVNPNCSFTIGRHSKSVDTIRHRCGRCKDKLIEVNPDGTSKKKAQPSAYNLFVKQYSKEVRERLVKQRAGITQGDVMKELGRLWREHKISE